MTSDRRTNFLNEMGVGPLWTRRDAAPAIGEPVASAQAENPQQQDDAFDAAPDLAALSATAPSASEIAVMDWAQLQTSVAGCVKCGLCKSRTKTVFGAGDEKAKWLFIGEGPGRNEDLQGEPFVGPAGKLLDNMLRAIGLTRGENAYIANIVKCRPIGDDGKDRPPTPEEAAACMPYLQRQIALIEPAVIVALGKTAALSLLGLEQDTAVAKLRGKVHQYAGLPLVVTYHPAYLLRKLSDKGKTWSDLCLAMNAYANSR
jgi:DNA polymerase